MAHPTCLTDPSVLVALWQAWQDSRPGASGGHEEGGFVLREPNGSFIVERWSKGEQATIILSPHKDCRIGEREIVVSFHTHPNTGSDYLQEPSETDRRAVRDDPDLKDKFYEGELVISQKKIYLIEPDDQVSEVGNTQEILARD
ncbi:MAG: hypothetical protein HY741_27555 [Chloroflexi bacterium]|nr:hypothetical protein [Chloroflexota bacterium]